MKFALLIFSGALILASCDSTPSPEENKKNLVEGIKTYKKEKGDKLFAHAELIDKYRTRMRLDAYRPAKSNSGIKLNFENNTNVFQMNFNYWADTSSLGEQNRHFWDEVHMKQLIDAIDMPIDSFRPKFNDQGRLRAFEELTTSVGEQMSDLKYIVGVYSKKNRQPVWYGSEYEPGIYEGKIIIYDVLKDDIAAIIEFSAMSSESVSAQNYEDLYEAAKSDFSNKIFESFKKALTDNFIVKGKPGSLKATPGY